MGVSTRRPCVCLTNEHISPPRLFRERLSQLRLRLEEVGAERAPEYTEPLGGLQRSLKIRIQVAGIYKGFCLDVIRNKYECELQGAKQHLEVTAVGAWGRTAEVARPALLAELLPLLPE